MVISIGPQFSVILDSHRDKDPGRTVEVAKLLAISDTRDTMAVAIKSEEVDGQAATYITVFNVADGRILFPESKIGNVKFEGIEFI